MSRQTKSSCPTCGTAPKTCGHCATYRNHEVATVKRQAAQPAPELLSCPHCGTGPQTCNHCETYRGYEVAQRRHKAGQ